MLLDIPFPMNYVIIDQLALNLVDICLANALYMLCKFLLCFQKFVRLTNQKSPKFGLQKFEGSASKQYISLSVQGISTTLISKSKLGYVLFNIKELLKIKQKTAVLLLINANTFFRTPGISFLFENILSGHMLINLGAAKRRG